MSRHRQDTFANLARLGISRSDAAALVRASATLSTWSEHECNGAIQRDEVTDIPYWYDTHTGDKIGRTSDREAGALKRAHAIAASYGLTAYYQGDPRGCALYLLTPEQLSGGKDISCYYSRGIAVVAK